jgi:predicted Zn-dependent protease with MMP-like domain
VGAVTGIDEITTLAAEVGQVESVEAVAAQLEDALDEVAVKVENFEASVLKDMGEVEKAILNRVMEVFGECGEGFGEQSAGRHGGEAGGDFRGQRG